MTFLENNSLWKRSANFYMGSCYSLKLPESIRSKAILLVRFNVKLGKNMYMFVHSDGLFNTLDPWRTLEYSLHHIHAENGYEMILDYQQNSALDFDGKSCEANKSYDFIECVENKVFEVNN